MSPQEYVANQARKNRKPATQCPYGCAADEANNLHYCKHLVGWTNDDEVVELRITGADGTIDTGATGVEKREIDPELDMLVPTNSTSKRVYRSLGDPLVDQTAKNLDEVATLKRQVEELRLMLEEKADKKKPKEPANA